MFFMRGIIFSNIHNLSAGVVTTGNVYHGHIGYFNFWHIFLYAAEAP